MYIFIQLTTAGTDTGPFNLYSNVGSFSYAFKTDVAKSDLLSGISIEAPLGTTIVRIASINTACTNYVDLLVSGARPTGTGFDYVLPFILS